MRRTPIGHRRRGDEDRRFVGEQGRRVEHLLRRLHIHALHATRRGQMHRTGDQSDLGTGIARRAGNGKAHLAARQIGDAAHRIDCLESRSCRHQHMVSDQLLGRQIGRHVFENLCGFEHAAVAGLAAGLLAVAHAQNHRTILCHGLHIALGRGMQPHIAVHGRCQQKRHALDRTRQAQQAQQLVRAPLRQPGDEIRAARRDQHHIGLAAQVDVRHVVRLAGIPLGAIDRAPAQGLHGDRGDELLRGLGHDDLNRRPRLDEQAAKLGGLVTSHPATEAQNDVFSSKLCHDGEFSRQLGRDSRSDQQAIRTDPYNRNFPPPIKT